MSDERDWPPMPEPLPMDEDDHRRRIISIIAEETRYLMDAERVFHKLENEGYSFVWEEPPIYDPRTFLPIEP